MKVATRHLFSYLWCVRTQMHCYGNLEEQKSETNTSFSLDCLLTSRDIGLQLSGIPLVRKGFDIITSGSDNKKFETCPLCTNNQFIALAFSSCIPLLAQFRILERWRLMTFILGPNVSTTPIMAMGCRQCLPLSVVPLKGKHC